MSNLLADNKPRTDWPSAFRVEAVRLRLVGEADLPALLEHRNRESTQRWLEYQSLITEVQQNAWYKGGGAAVIRIIEYRGQSMGLGRIDSSCEKEVLVGLDVFEEFRGKGLGHAFFSVVCSEAAKSGSRLALWVFLENQPAVSIYRKADFVEDPNSPVRYLPRCVSAGTAGETHPYVKMVRDK